MAMDQLNAYLATHSYLGSEVHVTLEDHNACRGIKSAIDAEKFPHLARWHKHISYLMQNYPKTDPGGNLLEQGQRPVFDGAADKVVQPEKAKPAPVSKKDKKDSDKVAPEHHEPKPETKEKGKKDSDKVATEDNEAKPEAKPKQDAQTKKGKANKNQAKQAKKEDEAPAEPTAEELAELAKQKRKKVIKEGGKRGVEIEGAADMGGLQFFCTQVDEPDGDLELLVESMKAMNAKCDPAEEERKGGSGHIGKMIFSAGVEQLALVAYVPEAKYDQLSCEEWISFVLNTQGGEIVGSEKGMCRGCVKADPERGIFPLKIREKMIIEANNFLRQKGLFPEDDDDSDEMVFGDDDFPS